MNDDIQICPNDPTELDVTYELTGSESLGGEKMEEVWFCPCCGYRD